MRKAVTSILASLLLVGSLAGCGVKDNTPAQTAGSSTVPTSSQQPEPQKGGKVTLYSPNAAEVNNPIIKEFQDRTGIEVQLISGGTGDLLKRVQAEASNPLGDVFWAGGADSLEAYKQFFEPYQTKEFDNLAPQYVDKNNIWTPFAALPMIIMYNKDLVKEGEEPKGWTDLTDPKWKGKIAFADPAKSGSAYTQLITMLTANGKDDGWGFVKKFVTNLDGKVLSGSGLVYKGVADKEFALGVTLEEAALRYVEGGAKVGIIYPEEGTSTVPDGAAIIKGAKNLDQAKQFIDFLVSKDVQSLIQKEFKRRSVRKDAETPNGIADAKDIKVVDYDFDWAATNKDSNIKRFGKIVTGQE
ncbi:ABC transporter substrate-binding protein [Paenibacillus eucommiae]|uniref:Iron(III) transport system substrate-binding protein n=1 Tax=Paenibacillus eucommiae TaxID=1355755 RepID=A0ABS4J8H5_9BACL|nr:ABC transporter substrate-binding protein [Paenibacillus eucommiae]MBP1995560.1 iron(III) transport system substrate-binding protein [Paenibacillus eucommiae]